MTPTEVQEVAKTFRYLWSKVRWSDGDFDAFGEGCERIDISPVQADAALRQLKRSSDKYPTVAAVLKALLVAEGKPARGSASFLPPEKTLPPIEYDQDGLTSFERRVIEDPRFRAYARKHNQRFTKEREDKLREAFAFVEPYV